MKQKRTEAIRVTASPRDAAMIRKAAADMRLTVSTFMLIAGLQKANEVTGSVNRAVVEGQGE